MRLSLLCALAALIAAPALAEPPMQSPRPPAVAPNPVVSTRNAAFLRWLDGFRSRASAAGIPGQVLDAALSGLRYNTDVVQKDRTQNEFSKTVWVYLDSAASDARIAAGKKALQQHAALLDRIETRYGVEKEILTAIWGLESAYGTYRGTIPTIEALATLAHDGRRGPFFEGQLLDALRILASGDARLADLRGSWAGAMGHTQFMPSSYLAQAQDFDGDGRRDIWGDDPADALASAAAYLSAKGWQEGLPWGIEVTLPQGFNHMLARRALEKLPSQWASLGVRAADGTRIPDHGPASILLPGGHQGAAFMIFRNFEVLESYNTADAYVIGVGHLADRIAGGGPIRATWPRADRALGFDERIELQRRLRAAGFDPQKLDGLIGPLTINAVRAYQKSRGLTPDGYASPALLTRLRTAP